MMRRNVWRRKVHDCVGIVLNDRWYWSDRLTVVVLVHVPLLFLQHLLYVAFGLEPHFVLEVVVYVSSVWTLQHTDA